MQKLLILSARHNLCNTVEFGTSNFFKSKKGYVFKYLCMVRFVFGLALIEARIFCLLTSMPYCLIGCKGKSQTNGY